jgi:hypothetical protein
MAPEDWFKPAERVIRSAFSGLKEASSDHHEGASVTHRSSYFHWKAALPVHWAAAALGIRPQPLGS